MWSDLVAKHDVSGWLYRSYMVYMQVFLIELINLLDGQVCSLLGLDVLGLARSLVCF